MTGDGRTMAMRAVRGMIEFEIPESPERERLLRHIDSSRSPLDSVAASREQIGMDLVTARRAAMRLWAIVRRYEPDALDLFPDDERAIIKGAA